MLHRQGPCTYFYAKYAKTSVFAKMYFWITELKVNTRILFRKKLQDSKFFFDHNLRYNRDARQ